MTHAPDDREIARAKTRRRVFRAASYLTLGQPYPEGAHFQKDATVDAWSPDQMSPRAWADFWWDTYRSWVFS